MRKRILALFLALVMCLSLLPVGAWAEELTIIASGYCGGDTSAEYDEASKSYKNLSWTLDEEGTLTISGEGKMMDYSYYTDVPWYPSGYFIKSVNIGKNVTSIGIFAFSYCGSLTSVTIPGSVQSVGALAFYNCFSLMTVKFAGNAPTEFAENVFFGCAENLKIIAPCNYTWGGSYPGNIETWRGYPIEFDHDYGEWQTVTAATCTEKGLEKLACSLCSTFETREIEPLGHNYVDNMCTRCGSIYGDPTIIASGYCGGDPSYELAGRTESAANNPEWGIYKNLVWRLDTDGVLTISGTGKMAMNTGLVWGSTMPWSSYIDKISSVVICEGVTSVGFFAFVMCDGIKSVTLPEGLTTIAEEAFALCGFEEITIPSTVNAIGIGAFGSEKLVKARFLGEEPSNFGFNSMPELLVGEGEVFGGGPDNFTIYADKNHTTWKNSAAYSEAEQIWHGHHIVFEDMNCEHEYNIETVHATCTSTGYTTYTCTKCGLSYTDNITKLADHDYEEELTAATCTEDGLAVYTCKVCGDSYSEVLPAKGHTIYSMNVVPNCTSGGFTTYRCSVCGYSYTDYYNEPSGHSFSDWSISRLPTEAAAGLKTHECTVCGFSETEDIPSLTSTIPASGLVGGDDGNQNMRWQLDEYGVLTLIGDGRIPNFHISQPGWEERVGTEHPYNHFWCAVIPAGVTETGGKVFNNKELTSIVFEGDALNYLSSAIMLPSPALTLYVPANNNTWTDPEHYDAETQTYDGFPIVFGGTPCRHCFTEHVTERTCTSPGYKTMTCAICGSSYDYDFVPATGHDFFTWSLKKAPSADSSGVIEHTCLTCGTVETKDFVSMTSGSVCDGIDWYLDSDGMLIVSGEGQIPDYSYNMKPSWYQYRSSIKSLIISDGISGIGSYAFSYLEVLRDVTIPAGMSVLGDYAFSDCRDMSFMIFGGDEPEYVGEGSMYEAYPLVYVPYGNNTWTSSELYNSETHVWNNNYFPLHFYGKTEPVIPTGIFAYGYCGGEGDGTNLMWTLDRDYNLVISGSGRMADYSSYGAPWSAYAFSQIQSVTISDGVTYIGDYAFHDCRIISELSIPDSVLLTGEYSFSWCTSLTDIDFGKGLREIGKGSFDGLGAKSITIPGNVLTIGDEAFRASSTLTDVVIENGVQSIGQEAFSECDVLENVSIPASVTQIGPYAFQFDPAVMSITVDDANESYCSVGGVLFTKDMSTLVFYPDGRSGSYVVPDGVKVIGDSAFHGCDKLTGITLPEGLTHIGFGAFFDCSGITELTLPDSLVEIGDMGFFGLLSVEKIKLGSGLKTIGYYALPGLAVESIVFPDGIKEIRNIAVCSCPNLSKAIFEGDAPEIFGSDAVEPDAYAMFDVGGMELVFAENAPDFAIYAPMGNTTWTDTEYYDAEAHTWHGYPIIFYTDVICDHTYEQSSVTAPTCLCEGHTTYTCSKCGFSYVDDFTSPLGHDFGAWQTVIAAECTEKGLEKHTCTRCDAFETRETAVLDHNYVDGICTRCGEVYVPLIASGYCGGEGDGTNLKWSLDYDGTFTISGTGAMQDFEYDSAPWKAHKDKIKTLVIEEGATSIGRCTFGGCENLRNISIPDSVAHIGGGAFSNCSSLASVIIPIGVKSISTSFLVCYESLRTVVFEDAVVDENGVLAIDRSAFVTSGPTLYYFREDNWDMERMNDLYDCSLRELSRQAYAQANITDKPESEHNYPSDCNEKYIIENSKAKSISITFSANSALGQNDILAVFDENDRLAAFYTRAEAAGKTIVVPGTKVTLWLNAEGSDSAYGYKLDNISFECYVHSYTDVITEQTCLAQGYTTHTCSVCGHSYVDTYTPILGHDFGKWYEVTPATCTEKGLERRECSRCDASETRETAALGHNFVNHYCTRCDANDYKATGTCGDLTWTLDNAGTLTISGKGRMGNYTVGNAPWKQYVREILKVVIGEGVTDICFEAFEGCINLKYLTVEGKNQQFSDDGDVIYNKNKNELLYCPKGKTGEYAVYGGVKTIKASAFEGCTKLTKITINNSITSIEDRAFYGCTSLKEAYFVDRQPQYFGSNVFDNCAPDFKITAVNSNGKWTQGSAYNKTDGTWNGYPAQFMDKNVKDKGSTGSTSWSLDSNGTLEIGSTSGAMTGSIKEQAAEVKSIVVSEGTTSIPEGMFDGCENLESVELPDTVTEIGDKAFKDCEKLSTIEIPENVEEIAPNAFDGCKSLTEINVSEDNPKYSSSDDGKLFDKEKETLICVPAGAHDESYEVPASVNKIGAGAFSDCETITEVTMPEGVKEIGDGAFAGCDNLSKINVKKPALKMMLKSARAVAADDYMALPTSVEKIGARAFFGCESIIAIRISKNVTDIGAGAFASCANLVSIEVEAGNPNYCAENGILYSKDMKTLICVPAGLTDEYVIPETVKEIAGGAFAGCTSDLKVTAPAELKGADFGACTVKYAGETEYTYTTVTVAPTCTKDGYTQIVRNDGEVVDRTTVVLKATGHRYGAWVITTEASCTKDGERTRYCANCEATETDIIKGGHTCIYTVTPATCETPEYTVYTCIHGDFTNSVKTHDALGHDCQHHDGKAATCTDKGFAAYDTCSRCSYSTYEVIPATGHHFGEWQTTKAPDCTHSGTQQHTCPDCKTTETKTINALGHDYNSDGVCTRCGEKKPDSGNFFSKLLDSIRSFFKSLFSWLPFC